jgi:hypothetical protein
VLHISVRRVTHGAALKAGRYTVLQQATGVHGPTCSSMLSSRCSRVVSMSFSSSSRCGVPPAAVTCLDGSSMPAATESAGCANAPPCEQRHMAYTHLHACVQYIAHTQVQRLQVLPIQQTVQVRQALSEFLDWQNCGSWEARCPLRRSLHALNVSQQSSCLKEQLHQGAQPPATARTDRVLSAQNSAPQ